jgi:alkylation response protein AidB-like acyl-CoA dehydrogenase
MNAPEPLALASRLLSRRDVDFQLHELLRVDTLIAHPRFADHSRETFAAALDLAERLATDEFAPHNRKADLNEPHFDGERVHMIPEVKAALDAFRESGLIAAGFDASLGGMQLPYTVAQACFAYFNAANVATAGYPFLTMANANLLAAFGSPQQKAKYLPHLLSGRFFGTMCLSEPQAGSSLSDIRTRAERQPDGTWRLYGNKMWISGGDHELSENIVHLVLARAKGAPPGVKGISLFLCPRWRVNDDGSLGARNDVRLGGLNHKMGFRGTVNCVLNFGERDGAVAELVGEENRGLACMFHMMNEARIGVGLGAVALGYTGYLHALDYARQRPQGRHAQGKDPTSPQVRIVEHADVRRMLLAQKTYVEGGLALCLHCAMLVDEQRVTTDDARRRELGLLLDLLTPIAKAWPAQWCLAANDLAIQVHGGYGYTRDYAVEQFYRDNRLNPIHEGTNGIQALDLLGRKVTLEGGAALKAIGREMMATVTEARATTNADLHAWADALATAADDLGETTCFLHSVDDLDLTLANAHVYLEAAGHIVVAWLWLKQAVVAHAALAKAGAGDQAFYRGKLQAARYFFGWELPKTGPQHALLRRLDATTLEMRNEWF